MREGKRELFLKLSLHALCMIGVIKVVEEMRSIKLVVCWTVDVSYKDKIIIILVFIFFFLDYVRSICFTIYRKEEEPKKIKCKGLGEQ